MKVFMWKVSLLDVYRRHWGNSVRNVSDYVEIAEGRQVPIRRKLSKLSPSAVPLLSSLPSSLKTQRSQLTSPGSTAKGLLLRRTDKMWKLEWGESRVREWISGMENKKTQFVTTLSTSLLLSLLSRGRRDISDRGWSFSTAAAAISAGPVQPLWRWWQRPSWPEGTGRFLRITLQLQGATVSVQERICSSNC